MTKFIIVVVVVKLKGYFVYKLIEYVVTYSSHISQTASTGDHRRRSVIYYCYYY